MNRECVARQHNYFQRSIIPNSRYRPFIRSLRDRQMHGDSAPSKNTTRPQMFCTIFRLRDDLTEDITKSLKHPISLIITLTS